MTKLTTQLSVLVLATASCTFDNSRLDELAAPAHSVDRTDDGQSDLLDIHTDIISGGDGAEEPTSSEDTRPDAECECSEGACCDGCGFTGAETLCDQSFEYRCETNACGADAQRRLLDRHCSGTSSECDGSVIEGIWTTPAEGECDGDQICQTDEETYSRCVECDSDCFTTEAGGACGVDCSIEDPCCWDGYLFRPPTFVCDNTPISTRYRCLDAPCGGVGQAQDQLRHCSGTSTECSDGNLRWGEWRSLVDRDCSTDEICLTDLETTPECVSCPHGCGVDRCLDCSEDVHCAEEGGEWCNGGTCEPCNTSDRCGPACVLCEGRAPICGTNGCECMADSCGDFARCGDGACIDCVDDLFCGADCLPCESETPWCADRGDTSECVECRTVDHCPGGDFCSDDNRCGFYVTLFFWEGIFPFGQYIDHRVLVGPPTSSNPEDGSWTVLASGDAMRNGAANGHWGFGLPIDLSDWFDQEVRLAFHYTGQHSDYRWMLDDICVGRGDSADYPEACNTSPFFFENFDSSPAPSLPAGWSTAAASTHEGSAKDWQIFYRADDNLSPYNRVRILNDGDTSRISRYLLTPPIDLGR